MAEAKYKKKNLFIIDFDNTLIAKNTDREIINAQSLFGQCISAKNYVTNAKGWAESMTETLFDLHERNIAKEDIVKIILDIPLNEGMFALCKHLQSYGDEQEVVILSHSNNYFIDLLLEKYELKDVFDVIFTYDCEWVNESGPLQVKPYDVPNTNCDLCPIDFCKGVCVETHLEKRQWEGDFEYTKVFFIGDGSADFCGSLPLREQDHIFARKDFPLHQKLLKDLGGKMRAKWTCWETGFDIINALSSFLDS